MCVCVFPVDIPHIVFHDHNSEAAMRRVVRYYSVLVLICRALPRSETNAKIMKIIQSVLDLQKAHFHILLKKR